MNKQDLKRCVFQPLIPVVIVGVFIYYVPEVYLALENKVFRFVQLISLLGLVISIGWFYSISNIQKKRWVYKIKDTEAFKHIIVTGRVTFIACILTVAVSVLFEIILCIYTSKILSIVFIEISLWLIGFVYKLVITLLKILEVFFSFWRNNYL